MTPETRARRGAAAILTAGLVAALVIYLTARPPAPNPLGYDPEDTKSYVREMEVYGGKANLLASEFLHWFQSLWHGRRLAFTVAVLSAATAGAYLFFRLPVPPDEDEDEGRP